MSQSVACPNCGKKLRISDDKIGQKGKCPGCNTLFKLMAKPEESRDEEISIDDPPLLDQSEEPGLLPSENTSKFEEDEYGSEDESFDHPLPPMRPKPISQAGTSPPRYLLLLISGWAFMVFAVLGIGFSMLTVVLALMGSSESGDAVASRAFAAGLSEGAWILCMSLSVGAWGQLIFAFRDIARNTHSLPGCLTALEKADGRD